MMTVLNFFRGLTIFSVGLFSSPGFSQELPVSVKVIDTKNHPITLASVTLVASPDSSRSQTRSTDSSGTAVFSKIKQGQYRLMVSAITYQALEKGISVDAGSTSFTVILHDQAKTLGGVTVVSTRPLMRQEDDKTIVDPEPLVSTSTSGFEVIEKTPGLFVDQDGNIYIASTTPAMILVNGRELKMSTADIATMLKSLPPNAIRLIEIVRTPSAKYSASGGGGVVNVILRKGVKLGLTGSINAGLQQGFYNNKFVGFTLNNNDDSKTSYLNLNYSRRNNYERLRTDRFFTPDSLLAQDAWTRYPADAWYGAYGITWNLDKKWELTFDANVTYNDYDNRSNNLNSILKEPGSVLVSRNRNQVTNDGSSLFMGIGLETRLKIDSNGSEWTADTWYGRTNGSAGQVFTSIFDVPFDHSGGGDGRSDNYRDYIKVKSDLALRMKRRFTFESGVELAMVVFRNEADYFSESGGVRTKDDNRTSRFRYEELINSAYLQGSKTFGKNVILKFGTRLENTNMDGRQLIPEDTSFTIRRTDLFPYLYLSKKVITIAGFDLRAYLVYRRTIARPVYEQLNPFPRYVDQFLTEKGNPALRPQFTDNYEANISVNETPLLAVGVNKTKDIFTNVVYPADSSRAHAERTYDNLGSNEEFYIRGLGAIPPGKRYFFVVGGQYNHNDYRGRYGTDSLTFKKGTWTFFTYHSLKLGKLSQFTLNGFIRLRGQQQFYELGDFGALNASINRRFMKEKLTVTLSVNDMFKTLRYHFTINQGPIDASGTRQNDTQRFGINLRYNFGIRKKEEQPNLFEIENPVR